MTIVFTCPYCQSQSEVPKQFVGQQGPCRVCGKQVRVPPPGYSRRSVGVVSLVLESGFFGAVYTGLLTLFLVTLPEIGSLFGVLQTVVAPTPADMAYQRTILGHFAFLGVAMVFGAFTAAALLAVIASRDPTPHSLAEKRRGAAWGCGIGTLLAVAVVMIVSRVASVIPGPTTLLAELLAVLGCGFVGSLLGMLRVVLSTPRA